MSKTADGSGIARTLSTMKELATLAPRKSTAAE